MDEQLNCVVDELKSKRLNGRERRAYHRFHILSLMPLKKRLNLTEGEIVALIRLAQAGDIEARNKVLLSRVGCILSSLKRVYHHLQEEFFSELVLTTIRCIQSYREMPGAKFTTYLFETLNFRVLELMKCCLIRNGRMVSLDIALSNNESETALELIPDTTTVLEIEEHMRTQEVLNVFDRFKIDFREREVLWAQYYLGFQPQEIADELGISRSAINHLASRGHIHVRQVFELEEAVAE